MAFSFLERWFRHRDSLSTEVIENAAETPQAEVQFLRGLRLASGQGAAQDYTQAAHWYAQAAEQDHTLAQFNLAMMYGQGQGVVRNEAKSLMWMTRAAKLGDAGAQYKLGVQQYLACRRAGLQGTPEGRIEALKWVRLSAGRGYRGAEGACEFVALGMSREEVAEGDRRATAFVVGK